MRHGNSPQAQPNTLSPRQTTSALSYTPDFNLTWPQGALILIVYISLIHRFFILLCSIDLDNNPEQLSMWTNLLIQTIPSKLLHRSILRALFLLPRCVTLGHRQRKAIVEDSRSKPAGMCVWPHSKWSIKQFLKGLHDKTLAASKNPRLRNG
ncbi:hypothetical protein P691DRAFT_758832 [Macrolepiota fuliginosa MF-IS2]|uniref:Uncharacterized protein n=1 Tax=Macrolepiota fuliginosa MF-IS2 TaxID=1400762 RepID=A0A9P6C2K0_9AGAR|nr:hypothetical protein P691DRAFT_758832 [Macrolepiota fuliginosa MF-IS2]